MVDSSKTKDYTPMNAIKNPPRSAIEPLPPPKRDFVEIAGWHRTESPDCQGTQINPTGTSWLVRATNDESSDPYLQLFHLHQGANAGECRLSCRLEIRAMPACPPILMTLGLLAGVHFDRLNSLPIQPTTAWQSIDLGDRFMPQPHHTRIIARLHLQSAPWVEIKNIELWQAAG